MKPGGLTLACQPAAEADPRTGSMTDSPPAPEAVLAAYRAVEEWVRAWAVSGTPPDHLPRAPVVCVALRLNGRLLGRADAAGESAANVWRAAVDALRDADDRLPLERDAFFEEKARSLAGQVLISLEISGALVPFRAESISEVSEGLSCGIDGVAARIGERLSVVMPSEMLAANMEPGEALAAALARAAADPGVAVEVRPPGRLGAMVKELGASLYRFRVAHIAQGEAGAPPMFLYRGGRVISEERITQEEIRKFAANLAEHLVRRFGPGRPGGTVWAFRGRVDPSFTPARDRALAALALLRFAADGGASPEAARTARDAAQAMLRTALDAEPPDEELGDGLTSAMFLIAAGADHDPAALLARSGSGLSNAVAAAIDRDGEFIPEAPVGSRGLLVLAMKEAHRAGLGSFMDGEPLWSVARRAALRDVPPARFVGQMPWLGWADFGWNDDREERPKLSAAGFREMRDQAYRFQLLPADAGEEGRDLVGGIVFPGGRTPLPTAQSARVLAFMATMLGDPRLTDPEEVPRELVRLLLGVRFLRQLAVDESLAWGCVDWQGVRWGVRASPWDQRASPEAAALTLITLTETLRSIRALEARAAREP